MKLLRIEVPCILGWPSTEGTWLYCDYFVWGISCAVFVLACSVTCGCFGNTCTCIYCILYCLYCVFVLFRLCIFILICCVCTSVRTTATEWQLNCNNNNNNNNILMYNNTSVTGQKSLTSTSDNNFKAKAILMSRQEYQAMLWNWKLDPNPDLQLLTFKIYSQSGQLPLPQNHRGERWPLTSAITTKWGRLDTKWLWILRDSFQLTARIWTRTTPPSRVFIANPQDVSLKQWAEGRLHNKNKKKQKKKKESNKSSCDTSKAFAVTKHRVRVKCINNTAVHSSMNAYSRHNAARDWLTFTLWPFYSRFLHEKPVYAHLFPHTRYMTSPAHSSRFDYRNNI